MYSYRQEWANFMRSQFPSNAKPPTFEDWLRLTKTMDVGCSPTLCFSISEKSRIMLDENEISELAAFLKESMEVIAGTGK